MRPVAVRHTDMTAVRMRRQDGFTLVELLVVVVVLGILGGIALPTFLQQRQRAWDSEAKSDLRNAVVQVEEAALDGLNYLSIDPAALRASDGVTLSFGARTGVTYCLEVDHARLPGAPDYHFDSVQARPVAGAC